MFSRKDKSFSTIKRIAEKHLKICKETVFPLCKETALLDTENT